MKKEIGFIIRISRYYADVYPQTDEAVGAMRGRFFLVEDDNGICMYPFVSDSVCLAEIQNTADAIGQRVYVYHV